MRKMIMRYNTNEGSGFLLLFTAIIALYAVVSIGIFHFHDVFAHVSNTYGNITVQTGWDQEPPLVDEINHIIVGVTREPGNEGGTSTPVRNALADMNIQIKYGGVTKTLDFVPSEEQAGWYDAEILPTRIGSYSLALNGTVDNQAISDGVDIEDVESKERISFPAAASSSSSGGGPSNVNLVSGQISNILNQITNDVNNIREDIKTLADSNSNIEQGVSDVKDIADRSYMLAVTAIGVGAAGILIGAAALVRTR